MAKGKVSHSLFFLLRTLIVGKPTRVSVVVPQKIGKTAVIRNKLRRKVYEAVRPLFSLVAPDVYIIIFAKSSALSASFAELQREIRVAFVKAGVLK